MEAQEELIRKNTYYMDKMEILDLRIQVAGLSDRMEQTAFDLRKQEETGQQVKSQIAALKAKSDELLRQISSTGYDELKEKLKGMNELLERLMKSEDRWQRTAAGLKAWVDEDVTSNQTIWDIEEFEARSIDRAVLERLKSSVEETREDVARQKQEAGSAIRELVKSWRSSGPEEKHTPNTWKMPVPTLKRGYLRNGKNRWRFMSFPIFWTLKATSGEMPWRAIWPETSCLLSCRPPMRKRQWKYTGNWTEKNTGT